MSEHDQARTDQLVDHQHRPGGALLFVACIALLLGGFWLMAYSFSVDSGLFFWAGLVVSGLAFAIPIQSQAR